MKHVLSPGTSFCDANDYKKAPLSKVVLDYLRANIRQGCRVDHKMVAVQGSVISVPPYLQDICQPATHTVNARQQINSEVDFIIKIMY